MAITAQQYQYQTNETTPQYNARIAGLRASTITSSSLAPTTSPQIVPPTPDTTNFGGITGGVSDSIIKDLQTAKTEADTRLKAQEKGASDITSIQRLLGDKASDLQTAQTAQGVDTETTKLNTFAQQLADLNAQASSLNREAQAIPLQTQERNIGTGATDAGVAPQTAGALRINALKALSIGQQADIASAALTGSQIRLNAAKDKAQQMIDLKYAPLEADLEARKQQYDLNKDILVAYDKRRTEALTIALAKEERDLADKRAREKQNSDNRVDYAKYAYESGQSDIASQITSLDPSSKTFTQDLAKLQSQIKNPMMALDIALKQAQLNKIQRETNLMGQPTATEKKAEADKLKSKVGQQEVLQDKLNLIGDIQGSAGFNQRVGSNIQARIPASKWGIVGKIATIVGIPGLIADVLQESTGSGQQFSGAVHRLSNQEFLDKLINVKSQGATFGALTDREGDALRASATQLNDWEIKNSKGIPTGIWNIDQASFTREIDRIKELANIAIQRSTGSVINNEDNALLDSVFGSQPLTPSNYFK